MGTNILLETGTNEVEIVEFYLELNEKKEYYGINVIKVQEIIRYPQITKIPIKCHNSFLGITRLRNDIIPLIDLGIYLFNKKLNSLSKVIIAEFNKMKIGFIVSGLTRIHRINWKDFTSPAEIEYAAKSSCITGIIKFDDRVVFVLDVEKIIAEMIPLFTEAGIFKDDISKKYKILIVEDSSTIRNMMVAQLKAFDIHAAKNGQEAYEYLLNLKENTDNILEKCNLVITDIEMPQMDGYTLTKKIKEDPVLKKIPVILFSSMITEKILHKGKAVGADDQISKPEIGELAKRALQLIEKTQNIE